MSAPFFPSVVDSSMLASYKSCPTLFRYQYLEGWTGRDPSPHLHAGGAFAHALEATRRAFYVDGQTAEVAITLGADALREFWGDYTPPAYVAKTLDRMLGAFTFYWANYPLNHEDFTPIVLPSGRRGIEFSFAHPLPIAHPVTGDPIIYCGRMDAIVNFAGTVYIVDEKTTSSLGPTWSRQWDLRSQFTGYAWGCRQAGVPVAGTIVRGVSILKTQYGTAQAVIYSPEWQVDRWYEELLERVEAMLHDWQRGRWLHNLDHSCADYGGCSFREPCSTQNPRGVLETLYKRARWNPLTRTTLDVVGED